MKADATFGNSVVVMPDGRISIIGVTRQFTVRPQETHATGRFTVRPQETHAAGRFTVVPLEPSLNETELQFRKAPTVGAARRGR